VVLLTLLVVSVWALVWMTLPMSKDPTPIVLTIPQGAKAPDIATILKHEGLIRSRWAFAFTVRGRRASEDLKAGQYALRRNMNMLQIIVILVRGESLPARVTIPEGYTVRQIAELLAEKGIVDERSFLDAARASGESHMKPIPATATSLEGYLFPDTYLFKKESKPDMVIKEMLLAFRRKVCERFAPDIHTAGLPVLANPPSDADRLYSVLIMASLIEREARVDKDRGLIASVLRNRLHKGMRLQVDATVLYALKDHRSRLYYRDYKTPSPYNTYLNPGLPPGPIANPGAKSIYAALHPAHSNYLYYVARPDGYHIFSTGLAQHNRAVAQIRRK
jgi:UPF0755 protein